MNAVTIIIIILVIMLLGGFRDWGQGPFYGVGAPLGGTLGLVILVLLILMLLGRV